MVGWTLSNIFNLLNEKTVNYLCFVNMQATPRKEFSEVWIRSCNAPVFIVKHKSCKEQSIDPKQ